MQKVNVNYIQVDESGKQEIEVFQEEVKLLNEQAFEELKMGKAPENFYAAGEAPGQPDEGLVELKKMVKDAKTGKAYRGLFKQKENGDYYIEAVTAINS